MRMIITAEMLVEILKVETEPKTIRDLLNLFDSNEYIIPSVSTPLSKAVEGFGNGVLVHESRDNRSKLFSYKEIEIQKSNKNNK